MHNGMNRMGLREYYSLHLYILLPLLLDVLFLPTSHGHPDWTIYHIYILLLPPIVGHRFWILLSFLILYGISY